ncbi:hypothetical protein NH44784_039861 [Achromobacter xylosoxidans NH44784-1996]|nr:hypothetical protein NH44784_039861 [Achromobacter xylosoxidans NH44784-1996]
MAGQGKTVERQGSGGHGVSRIEETGLHLEPPAPAGERPRRARHHCRQ